MSEDEKYCIRRVSSLVGDISQIDDRLYLGSYEQGAKFFQALKDRKITHILTVGNNMPPEFPEDFEYRFVPVYDSETEKIIEYWPATGRFIYNTLISSPKNVVFVHCYAGVSRSSSTIMAYYIEYRSKSLPTAYEIVRRQRPWIRPNRGFINQLKEYSLLLNPDFYDEEQINKYLRAARILRHLFLDRKFPNNKDKTDYIIKIFSEIFGEDNCFSTQIEQEINSNLIL